MSTDLHGPDAGPAPRQVAPPQVTPIPAQPPPNIPTPASPPAAAPNSTLPAAVGAQPTDPPGWRMMFAIVQNRSGELRNALTVATYIIAVLSLIAIILFFTGTAGWLALGSGTVGITVAARAVRALRKPATTDPGVSRRSDR